MQTSYEPALESALAKAIPAGSRVLLAGKAGRGPGVQDLARALERAGIAFAEEPLLEEREPGGRTFDAVVLSSASLPSLPSLSSFPSLLHHARAFLADKGRLLLAAPAAPGTPESSAQVIALSETGFVILSQEAGLLVARKESIFVTEYQEGDEEAILALFRGSFHVDRSLARWRWEYQENPYGNRTISEAFAEDGALVAHYAAYPVRFYRETAAGPEELPAQQVGDTMTAPEVRKIGRGPTSVLARTVRHFYARFCAGKVAFNYGFNTGNIQRFSMSFVGARRIEDAPFRVRELAGRPIPVPSKLVQWLGGYRCERISTFDERWDELFRRVRGAYGFLVVRDARYLDWRYGRCPDPEYFTYSVFRGRRRLLIGWGVFRQLGDRLFWGDALFDPRYPEAARLLLAHVLAQPAHQGTRVLETWATDRPAWWSRWIDALGFERRPEPDALGFVFVPFERDALQTEAELRSELYYTKGDGDLF